MTTAYAWALALHRALRNANKACRGYCPHCWSELTPAARADLARRRYTFGRGAR